MKMTSFKKALSLFVCIVLIAAMALTTGCKDKTEISSTTSATASQIAVTELGEGKTSFNFEVTDKDGNKTAFVINTDKEKVGDALQELELISGEQGDYGLYVKKVNGIVADYNTDGTYWAFYINGEMAPKGVDSTKITAGATYGFVVSK